MFLWITAALRLLTKVLEVLPDKLLHLLRCQACSHIEAVATLVMTHSIARTATKQAIAWTRAPNKAETDDLAESLYTRAVS
jgi:hypothetical protein